MRRFLLLFLFSSLCSFLAGPALAQVAHVTASESHTGTTGSASEASFSWTHTTTTDPQGVIVFTFVNANADDATGVRYDSAGANVSLTAVSGGRAVDTATEPGDVKAWFLGSSVPTADNPTITVDRTNNANVMYAVAITVTASTVTEVYTAGIALLQEDGAWTEQSVGDGQSSSNSVRYAGANTGRLEPTPVGANSTGLVGIDFGARAINTVRETTAGQGSRLVGFTEVTSDDRAGVHLAVREVPVPGAGCGTTIPLTGAGCK